MKTTENQRSWKIVLSTEERGKVAVASVSERAVDTDSGKSYTRAKREDEQSLVSCMSPTFEKIRLSRSTASGMQIPLLVSLESIHMVRGRPHRR